MTKEEILEEVELDYDLIGKSKETAGNQYKMTINRNGKSMSFEFHTNAYDEINLSDILSCLVLDRNIFHYMFPDYWTVDCFRREFGYNEEHKSDKELKEIMKQIERNTKGIENLFTGEELNLFDEDLD